MKLSDYVAEFLYQIGVRHVFAIAGGASIHLIDSIDRHPHVSVVCPMHEQGAAMAADGYARVSSNIGAAIATSGPGATNLLTGVCSAYYDSIPAIYITGQVSTFRMKRDTGVRQIGFQETDTVDIFKPVTKYAVQIQNAQEVRYELEKCYNIAISGRPGPVLIDIPDNLQREDITPEELPSFNAEHQRGYTTDIPPKIGECVALLRGAKRPVVISGWGIRSAKAEAELRDVLDLLSFPLAPTWATADLLPADHPLFIGTFGTHGSRYANFAVQNADLVLSIGSRLDTKATGSPINTFAREAKKIVVDIDQFELRKFKKYGLELDLMINMDAREFLTALHEALTGFRGQNLSEWKGLIASWKERYPICPLSYSSEKSLNPYYFIKELSQHCLEGEVIVTDTGCTLAWMMQGFAFKKNQRIFHDWNNTAMGWALPASMGASLSGDKRRVICVMGDGSLMMSIQELATIAKLKLPIKVILFNNHGYSMIRQTQDQWLSARYCASSEEGGVASPDLQAIASAFGFRTACVSSNAGIEQALSELFTYDGPCFLNVEVEPAARVIPQVKFGRPNEDTEPLLNREEFLGNMIVKPLKVSL